MAGPLVHLAAMEKTRDFLVKKIQLPCEAGTKVDVMAPDTTGGHPMWDVTSETGNLFDILNKSYEDLIEFFKLSKKDKKYLSFPLFSRRVQFICHYMVDSHTMGHIAKDTKKLENTLEPVAEFVLNKKKFDLNPPTFDTFYDLKAGLMKSSRRIYDVYRKPAKSWYFIFSGKFRKMIRESVKYGSEYTIAFINLCWDKA